MVGDAERGAPLLELGCLLRAYICMDSCFELSRQACTAAVSCFCGDGLHHDPKLRPTSSHGADKEHSSNTAQGSRRDFKLVGDFTDARTREQVRV